MVPKPNLINVASVLRDHIRAMDDLIGDIFKDRPGELNSNIDPIPGGGRQKSDKLLAAIAKNLYKSRRVRDELAPFEGLFHDPAWDILLDLFQAHVAGQRVPMKAAAMAGSVPPTTALRHVWMLEQKGLIVREADPGDARRHFVDLTANGLDYMRRVLEAFAQGMN